MNEQDDVLFVKDYYIHKIIAAGGHPILLPSHLNVSIEKQLDGLLLTGGSDVAPSYFGEEPDPNLGRVTPRRDQFELHLVKEMLIKDKPVLGICRGMQLLNIAAGGTVIQHIDARKNAHRIQHDQQAPTSHRSHSIHFNKESRLYTLIGDEVTQVNSFHHQAVGMVPRPLIKSAYAKDGIIEAIESTTHRFAIGVQWHPECLQGKDSDALFLSFMRESGRGNARN